MKILYGSASVKLARKIAELKKGKVSEIELSKFSNGEDRVWIKDKFIRNKAVVVQSFSNPPDHHIIEFCLICDALKRMGIKDIIAVIPWFAYCVQDKIFRPGEPLSSKVIAKIVQNSRVSKIITIDLHNETMAGFFDIPFTHLSANQLFIDYFKDNKVSIDLVISPDVGGLKRASKFALALGLPLSTINKKRDLATGKVSILGINEKVKSKNVMIVDDFVSTGQTLMEVAKFLKLRGVKKVSACLTHHFYINHVQEQIEKSKLDMLYVTDTIQNPQNSLKYNKLKILSVAELIAKNIKI